MAAIPSATNNNTNNGQQSSDNPYRFALSALTLLFFMWGFITCLNDILIPHLKNVFDLNYTQAMLIQFCFFGAYFVVSVPAGNLVKKIGYKSGIVCGLWVASFGCLLFIPASHFEIYPLFLGALFVLASGITVLQVAANPYVTVLGPPATASSRLNLTQAFNSLGTTLAPFFGSALILSSATVAAADAVVIPYLILASALAIIGVVIARLDLPLIEAQDNNSNEDATMTSAWTYRHLRLGVLGVFLYVGAEVAIGSFLVNFISQADISGMSESEAAHYVAWYWGGAMVGRFIGAAVLQKLNPGAVLAFNAFAAIALLVAVIFGTGKLAMYCVLLSGLCNSVMFPIIFSMALAQLGKFTSQGSGLLCLAIVGGAVVPLLQGILADLIGIQLAFVLPLACYIYIAYYGLWGCKPQQ